MYVSEPNYAAFVFILIFSVLIKAKQIMFTKKLLPLVLLALSHNLFAVDLPSAGGQMQQIPPAPVPQKWVPKIEIKQDKAPVKPESDGIKINVKRLQVAGAQAYSEAELIAVTEFKPGSELTLSGLRAMATKIAGYYHRHGYFVAQAYLPAQDIKNGVVTIAVIEGHYGKIKLNNEANLSGSLLNSHFTELKSGDPVIYIPLENSLLLLSDVPGVKVKSTMVPGSSLGASDLIVDVMPGKRVTGAVDADNAGNLYTGRYRVGATVNVNNLTGHGDVASLRAMTSGSGMHYARAAYQMQLAKATGGIAYSYLDYELGHEFESLQAHGTVKTASLFGSYPLIRSRNNNLYAGLAYDDKTIQDKVDSIPSVTDKSIHVLMGSLYGDHADSLGGGGFNHYSLTWSFGELDIETPAVRALNEATVRSNGHYNKLGFNASRLQRITESISLYAGINGQLASKNLDVSEKMELGGMYAVRAYPEGEAYADEGYVLHLEARKQLPQFSEEQHSQVQLIGFVDTGSVKVNKETGSWATPPNRRTLSGAGIGINWSENNNFTVRTYYAFKLGNEDATSAPDKSGRFWIQVVKYF